MALEMLGLRDLELVLVLSLTLELELEVELELVVVVLVASLEDSELDVVDVVEEKLGR